MDLRDRGIRWGGAVVAVVAVVLTAADARADTPIARSDRDRTCEKLLRKHFSDRGSDAATIDAAIKSDYPPGSFCRSLAAAVYTGVSETLSQAKSQAVESAIPASAVQPPDTDTDGGQGTPAQTAAVPSVQPMAEAGGTVAFAGTQDGPRLVTALAVNPVALAASDVKTLSWGSRLVDLSIVLPIDVGARNVANRSVDFVGFRLRVNAGAFSSGSKVYAAAVAAYTHLYDQSEAFRQTIEELLTNAPDVDACKTAIESTASATIEEACNGTLEFDRQRQLEQRAKVELSRARQEADRSNFGLDVRADFGNPTFAQGLEVDGQYWVGGLAAGRRLGDPRRALSLRARGGVAYSSFTVQSQRYNRFSLDFGAGAELSAGPDEIRRTRTSVGVEGRLGHPSDALDIASQSNYVQVQFGITVPLADGKNVNVGVSVPLHGARGTMFSVSGDWATLLADVVK